jgi:hypothetical protein
MLHNLVVIFGSLAVVVIIYAGLYVLLYGDFVLK